jgi:hypothetical protein
MSRSAVAVVALGCLALADGPVRGQGKGPGPGDPQAARFGWVSSLAAGKEQARQSGKPLMVVLRCGP